MITISGEAISKSPINKSKSKQMYSFSKSRRFPDPFKKEDIQFYNFSFWKGNRSTSMGYGTKYDFTKENKDKCQNFYNLPTDFDTRKPFLPAYTFGMSRSCFDKVYYDSIKMVDKNVPGPGKYNYLKPFGHDSSKFSLSSRAEDKSMRYYSQVPGPGSYKLMTINPKGIYPLSNFRNTTSINFSNNREKRFSYNNLNTSPGPGTYDVKPLIDGKGFNFISKYKSSQSQAMKGKGYDLSSKYTNLKSKFLYLRSWTGVLYYLF